MSVQFVTKEEINHWNEHVIANPDGGNPLQMKDFLAIKERKGTVLRFVFCGDVALSILEKNVPLLGKLWYCMKGPGIQDTKALVTAIAELKDFAQRENVFCIKIEPEIEASQLVRLLGNGVFTTRAIQPNVSTVIVDTSPEKSEIVKSFSQTARRNIRAAEKAGARVEEVVINEVNSRIMYDLYTETGRGNFAVRPYNYHSGYWMSLGKLGSGKLFFAYDSQNTVCAAAFVIITGKKALYKDGASVRKKTVPGISHLLQCEIMYCLHDLGVKSYDLQGTPSAARIDDTSHPFYGLGRFKTSFNKTITEYVGTLSIHVSPLKAWLWDKIIERVVRRGYAKIHGESYY